MGLDMYLYRDGEEVAYWRKANAVHRWFVEHVQDGKDECQESLVTAGQLRELVATCEKVLDCTEMITGKVHNGTMYDAAGKHEIYEDGEKMSDAGVALAKRLLPTTRGFFFGSTDYDQYYVQDLKKTVEMLKPLLGDESGEFYYRASW